MLVPDRATTTEVDEMKQEFHLILGIDEFTDSIADALFQVGFDDALRSRKDSRLVL
jgi:hypothetical protein